MRISLLIVALILSISTDATEKSDLAQVVMIPYMERAAVHRDFADALLKLALEVSEDKYGPFTIIQEKHQSVMLRQLQELEKGERLSVAISMPMAESLEKAQVIHFPVLRGLSSYRMFLVHNNNLIKINEVESLNSLRALKVGQGPGWSTAPILENNGFQVVYSGRYSTLIPMLRADRFQLYMRSVYEIGPEYIVFKSDMPELEIADEIAAFTYLPMYFFVSKKYPQLAERLEFGLKKTHANGQFNDLFNQYFEDALKLMSVKKRKMFYIENTNIDESFFELDKPFLLESIKALKNSQKTPK